MADPRRPKLTITRPSKTGGAPTQYDTPDPERSCRPSPPQNPSGIAAKSTNCATPIQSSQSDAPGLNGKDSKIAGLLYPVCDQLDLDEAATADLSAFARMLLKNR